MGRLGARHVRTLKMADDVLCARITPDGRLLALALLDSTIQACALRYFCRPDACVACTCVCVGSIHDREEDKEPTEGNEI